jgi:hypothetical protein
MTNEAWRDGQYWGIQEWGNGMNVKHGNGRHSNVQGRAGIQNILGKLCLDSFLSLYCFQPQISENI